MAYNASTVTHPSTTAQLGRLESAGLIQLAATQPELEYVFRHGLIQEATYSTLLKQQRRAWHQACGEVLESLLSEAAADVTEALTPALAEHFSIAGDQARAARYFVRAADAAFDRYANTEAGDYYAKALAITANRMPYSPADVKHCALRYGRTLELRSQFEAALQHYETTEALARRHGDHTLELATLLERATILSTANLSYDPERSRALLEQAAALAERTGERATQARLHWTLMLQNTMRGGDPDERVTHGERALAIARELGLREQMAYTHQDLWFGYAGRGQWTQTRETLLEASRLWRELAHPVGECEATLRLSQVAMLAGDYEESLALTAEGYRIAEAIHSDDMRALSHAFVGLIHAEHGQYDEAVRLTEAAIDLGGTTGNVTVLIGSQADLALTLGELGAVDRGLPFARAALALAEGQFPLLNSWPAATVARLCLMAGDTTQAARLMADVPSFQDVQRRAGFLAYMWLHVALAGGELALAQGHLARAVTLMTEVAASLQTMGLRFRLPDILHLRGQALAAQGRLAQARSDLQAARLEAIALNSRRTLWRILASLAEIEAQTGQHQQAEALRRQAVSILETIADHAPSPELRRSFLAQPNVHKIVGNEAG